MKGKHEKQSIQRKDMIQLFLRSLVTGVIGGLLLSSSWFFLYYFNFVEFSPTTILRVTSLSSKWTNGWIGIFLTMLFISIYSLLIAIIYYAFLKSFNMIWVGVIYGLLNWLLMFAWLGYSFSELKAEYFTLETIITTVCLFIFYGAFIGYSISYDYYRIKIDSMFQ